MLRLLLLCGLSLFACSTGLALGFRGTSLAIERLRLRVRQAGQCMGLINRARTARRILHIAGTGELV